MFDTSRITFNFHRKFFIVFRFYSTKQLKLIKQLAHEM